MTRQLLLLLFFWGLISCNTAMDEAEIETWWINSAKVDCTGVGPMSCFEIQKGEKIDQGTWELFYSPIEGFEYTPGLIYRVKVQINSKTEPIPADASSLSYKVVEVLSQEADPALRITSIWKVIRVGELTEPLNFGKNEPLIFEFNASQRSYFGDLSCNTVRGEILENDGENLKLGPGATTMMSCPSMEVEQAISQALIQVKSYQVKDGKLLFFDEKQQELMAFQLVD
ncbi:MAG: DUF4377 domain-containing protein [Bacteroidota bacterium]